MSAEEGNNRSGRAKKLFNQVSADIATQSPGLEPAQEASAPQGQEAPAETSTNDGKAPSDVGVTPGVQKEPEVRRHVEIPFSRETYANLDRLRELGLRPTYSPEGNFWSGDLSIGERRELHKNGVRTSFAHGVEVPGDHWTYEARGQLKELGLYWDRASESWCGLVDDEDLESLARYAYIIGIRVYADGEDLTREYRIEECRARKREPTFIPDRPTVLGLDDEVLDKEATRYAKLALQSFRALPSEAREEIGQLLAELRIPTDPETAELAWTELRPVEAGDIRAKSVFRLGSLLGTLSVGDYLRLEHGEGLDGVAAVHREVAALRADDLHQEARALEVSMASAMWWFNHEISVDPKSSFHDG